MDNKGMNLQKNAAEQENQDATLNQLEDTLNRIRERYNPLAKLPESVRKNFVAVFGVLLVLSRTGFEAENIDDFKGLNDRNPWLAFLMMVIMMSMAGVPFMVGFYAKWMVLQSIVDIGLVWLAILGVLFSVIGAFYYLRVVKCLYFDKPEDNTPIEMSRDTEVVISANGLLLVVLGLYPTALMSLCSTALLG